MKMGPAEKEVSATITFPGMATLPIPPAPTDCVQSQRSLVLELRNASGQFWQQPLPASSSFTDAQGKRFTLKATPVGNEVRVEVVPGAAGLTSREK